MKNKELLENVKHFTKARPFSIHKTEIGADSTNALYVHYHPEMEFIYLDEGSMTFYVEGKQYNMKEGDALFIPPALVHNAVKNTGVPCRHYAVSYTHLTLPTKRIVEISGGAGYLKKKRKKKNNIINHVHRKHKNRHKHSTVINSTI